MRLQGYHRVTADVHTPAAEDRDVTRSTLPCPCLRCRRDVPFPLKRAKHKPSTRRLAVLALHCATVGSSGSWGSATGAVDRCLSVPGACGSCRSKSSLNYLQGTWAYADCSRQLHVYCRTTCNVVGMYEHVLLCRVGRISSALPSWKGLVVYGVSVGRYWHENAMDVRVVGRGPTPVAASIACTGAGWC